MQIIRNFRSLAKGLKNKDGKIIKPNSIFRSGYISDESKPDFDKLRENHIKSIYDLRNDHEIKRDFKIDGIRIKHFAIPQTQVGKFDKDLFVKLSNGNIDDFMLTFYQDHLVTSPVIKNALVSLITEEEPFLFHCHAGKDRTGVVGAILMEMLDFDEEAIIKEYLLLDPKVVLDGNQSMREDHQFNEEVIAKLEPMHRVKELYIRSFINEIKNRYGDFDHYFEKHFGITKTMIENFKSHFLI